MPIYQCKPGSNSNEPWRHGVPVYALPFPFDSNTGSVSGGRQGESSSGHNYNSISSHNTSNATSTFNNNNNQNNSHNNPPSDSQFQMHQYEDDATRYTTHTLAGGSQGTSLTRPGSPIRRVKHAEIVLVDEVSIHYGHFWLRLRWPGNRGGVAGYIALGGLNVLPMDRMNTLKENVARSAHGDGGGMGVREGINAEFGSLDGLMERNSDEDGMGLNMNNSLDVVQEHVGANNYNSDQEPDGDDLGDDLPAKEPLAHPFDSSRPICESTGLYYPSTGAMELLANYDDGLSYSENGVGGMVTNMNIMDDLDAGANGKEPVFCRICREGLHDIDYDFEVDGGAGKEHQCTIINPLTAGVQADVNVNANTNTNINNPPQQQHQQQEMNLSLNRRRLSLTNVDSSQTETQNMPFMMQNHLRNESLNHELMQNEDQGGRVENDQSIEPMTFGDGQMQMMNTTSNQSPAPIKAEQTNHPYSENPLVAPCECSGSMAFVHYLCIEQWRCRSHHPDAKKGLNCETCKAPYTLPPPPNRQETQDEDWLEAMPPHVLAALRNPHPFWQLSAAVVRRRCLRPIAPVLTSPIVALYCRARRSLKKRGVSRRRWACSLCRRRARWKCVRCLRSYYCSRQCQNVSWHIVHKHVCYKPGRFWWSVFVYGVAYVYFIPGVLSHPVIYDLGLCLLWLSFVLMGVIGGGIATIMKREMGIDIRGRTLEVSVVLLTIWMGLVSWGLVWAFFGEPDQCFGVMDKIRSWQTGLSIPSFNMFESAPEKFSLSREQHLIQNLVLKPSKFILDIVDRGLLKTGPLLTGWICSSEELSDASTQTCLQMTRNANPDFMLPDYDGEKCSSDFHVISGFWYLAAFIHVLSTLWKRRERGRRVRNHHPRPHQD